MHSLQTIFLYFTPNDVINVSKIFEKLNVLNFYNPYQMLSFNKIFLKVIKTSNEVVINK